MAENEEVMGDPTVIEVPSGQNAVGSETPQREGIPDAARGHGRCRPPEPLRPQPAQHAGTTLLGARIRRRRYRSVLRPRRNDF